MTGAGSSTVAWTPESSYLGGPEGTPTYYEPGTNITAERAELNRNLLALLAPGDVETQRWLAQQLEGQLSVSFVLKNDDFHRLVFNDANTGFTSGRANSAEWYLGVDYFDGTTERVCKGWAPATCTAQYSGTTEAVRVTLTGAYGDEDTNTAITPGTVSNPGSEVPGHGTTLSIAGADVGDRLTSATLTFEGISRLQRGSSQNPIEAVAGAVREEVEMAAIYQGPTQYERVLGTTGATSVQATVDEVAGTLTFDAGGSTIADYTFAGVKPDRYDWVDLVNNEADLNEELTFRARGVTASDPTA